MYDTRLPSAASTFSGGMEDMLLQREAKKRQDLLDQHQIRIDEANLKYRQDDLDARQKDREERDADRKEAQKDKALTAKQNRVAKTFGESQRGDIMSSDIVADAEETGQGHLLTDPKRGLKDFASTMPAGPAQSAVQGQAQTVDRQGRPGALRFGGLPAANAKADQAQAQQAFIATRPPEEQDFYRADAVGLKAPPTRQPAAAGSFEAYMAASPEERAQIEKARKGYQQADDRPINVNAGPREAHSWILRDNKPLRVSESQIQPGDMPFSAARSTGDTALDRQRGGRVKAARGFLGKLDALREKINTKMGPEAGIGGMVRRGAAYVGLDTDVSVYERERRAGGRALAVAILGAQNLSDADADAWGEMLPGATTDKATAKTLIGDVEDMLDDMHPETARQRDGTPPATAPASGQMKIRKIGTAKSAIGPRGPIPAGYEEVP